MTCADCHKSADIMVGMLPGRDGKDWCFCSPCYRAGLTTTTDAAPSAPRKARR